MITPLLFVSTVMKIASQRAMPPFSYHDEIDSKGADCGPNDEKRLSVFRQVLPICLYSWIN
jgi:hypothetical protein